MTGPLADVLLAFTKRGCTFKRRGITLLELLPRGEDDRKNCAYSLLPFGIYDADGKSLVVGKENLRAVSVEEIIRERNSL